MNTYIFTIYFVTETLMLLLHLSELIIISIKLGKYKLSADMQYVYN